VTSFLRWAQRALFACAFLLLGYCAFVLTDSWIFERRAKMELERLRQAQEGRVRQAEPGGLIGRIDVDRLGVSVAVVEGTDVPELQRAAGHIAGTALPGESGNIGIAAHRDSFFRPLRNIRKNDEIRFTTPGGDYRYRVVSTKVVNPDDVSVLSSDGGEVLTLVTCYPFYFIGSAPNRFIVRAARVGEPMGEPNASALQPRSGLPHL